MRQKSWLINSDSQIGICLYGPDAENKTLKINPEGNLIKELETEEVEEDKRI